MFDLVLISAATNQQRTDIVTNVYGSRKKVDRRNRLFQIGIETLEKDGWEVERIPGFGKASVRRIRKGKLSRKASIRTSQDTYLAFPRESDDSGWVTLSEVDLVVAVSVDDRDSPKYGLVHFIEAEEVRKRFDRAYKARVAAKHTIPIGRGVWVPLYLPDAQSPVAHVGGGLGLDFPAVARVPLMAYGLLAHLEESTEEATLGARADSNSERAAELGEGPISEAKRMLSLRLGVPASSIKITVEA